MNFTERIANRRSFPRGRYRCRTCSSWLLRRVRSDKLTLANLRQYPWRFSIHVPGAIGSAPLDRRADSFGSSRPRDVVPFSNEASRHGRRRREVRLPPLSWNYHFQPFRFVFANRRNSFSPTSLSNRFDSLHVKSRLNIPINI